MCKVNQYSEKSKNNCNYLKKSVASSFHFLHARASLFGTGTTLHTKRRIKKRGCLDEEIPLLSPSVTLRLFGYCTFLFGGLQDSDLEDAFTVTKDTRKDEMRISLTKFNNSIFNNNRQLKNRMK